MCAHAVFLDCWKQCCECIPGRSRQRVQDRVDSAERYAQQLKREFGPWCRSAGARKSLEGTAVGTVLDGAEKKVKELEVFKKIGSTEPPATTPETEQRQQLLDGVGEQLGGLFPSLTTREPPAPLEHRFSYGE